MKLFNLFLLFVIVGLSDLNAQTRYDDSLALVDLYTTTNGTAWTTTWDLTEQLDHWHGVTIDSIGRVSILDLTNNLLAGSIPDLNLPNLTQLMLSDNQLTSVPDFSYLNNLDKLLLIRNKLTTVPDFSNLPQLTNLQLSNNLLTALPDFSSIPALNVLCLVGNQLTYIPDFSNLADLRWLNLNYNLLTTVPNIDLPKLKVLYLQKNRISVIPDFSNLPSLSLLYLNGNRLTSVPNFSNLPDLSYLSLGENQLTSIPDFSNVTKLAALLLYDNQLTDPIPAFTNLPNLGRLMVNNNALTFEDLINSRPFNEGLCASNWNNYNYVTQDSVSCADTIAIATNANYILDLQIDDTVTTSTYYWFKDGLPFDTTSECKLSFQDFQFSDEGVYHCAITNPHAPDLTLNTHPKTLETDTCFSTIDGCPAVCVNYSPDYTELYYADYPMTATNFEWTISPASALTNGSVFITGSDSLSTLEVGFSTTTLVDSVITIQVAANTDCGVKVTTQTILLDQNCVWPGDANNDKQADSSLEVNWIKDALGLGFAFKDYKTYLNHLNDSTLQAYPRSLGCIAQQLWDSIPQSANDWTLELADNSRIPAQSRIKDSIGNIINTFNLKYADGDGDGTLEYTRNWNSMKVSFDSVLNPSDHDVIMYQSVEDKSYIGNAYQKGNDFSKQLFHLETPDSVYSGTENEIVFIVKLGDSQHQVKEVTQVAVIGEGTFGTHRRPAPILANSHLTKDTNNLVDYPFVYHDSKGNPDSLRWYFSMRHDTGSVDFNGQEVCRIICLVQPAGAQNMKSPTDSFPVTFKLPLGGIGHEDGSITLGHSNEVTVWMRPNQCTDLTPTTKITPSNISGIGSIGVIVKISEVNGTDTDQSPIIIRIPSDPRLTFAWDPALVQVGFDPVQNTNWSYLGDNGIIHQWKYNDPNLVLSGGTSSSFGFYSTYDPQGTRGETTLTATIVPTSGGECEFSNNSDSERLVYFD